MVEEKDTMKLHPNDRIIAELLRRMEEMQQEIDRLTKRVELLEEYEATDYEAYCLAEKAKLLAQ